MVSKMTPKYGCIFLSRRRRSDYFTNLMVDKTTYMRIYKKNKNILLKKYKVIILPDYLKTDRQSSENEVGKIFNLKLRTYYPVGDRFVAAKKFLQEMIPNLKVDTQNRLADMEDLSEISDFDTPEQKDELNSSQETIIFINDTEVNNTDIETIDLVNEDTQNSVINLTDDNENPEAINDQNGDSKELDYIPLSRNTPIKVITIEDKISETCLTPMYKRKSPVVIDLCDSQDEGPNCKKIRLNNTSSDIINLVDTPSNNNNEQKRIKKRKRKSTPIRINTEVVTSTPILRPTVISSTSKDNPMLSCSPISKPCTNITNENNNAAGIATISNASQRNQRQGIETIKRIQTTDPAPRRPVLLEKLFPMPNSTNLAQRNNLVPIKTHTSRVGYNIYNPNTDKGLQTGLRPIVIDGSNVAMQHGIATGSKGFSVAGLEICMEYFIKRGHSVVKTFIPHFRLLSHNSNNPRRLQQLESQGKIICTPSRKVGGRTISSYDDRYIVQTAAEFGGVIVSNDNYRDLVQENEAWRETIEKRLLMFTWVEDCLMFPLDPLGRDGPTLDKFLQF